MIGPRFPALFYIFGIAIIAIAGAAVALATVPPQEHGHFVNLTVCTLTDTMEDHEATLARLSTSGEIWVRKSTVIGLQDKPGKAGCSSLMGATGHKLLIRGKAAELVGVLQ